MSTSKLPKYDYIVPRYYTRRLLRNLWRALKVERMNFIHGRVLFSDYIATVITNASHKSSFKYDDGKPYEILNSGVDGKTIDNFINKSSSLFFLERDAHISSLKTAIKTLQYLHLFLWCIHPERVVKWKSKPADAYDDLIIENLDDDFSIFETSTLFPLAVKIYKSYNGKIAPSVRKLIDLHNATTKYDLDLDEESNWPLLGVLIFFPIKGDIVNRCVYLSRTLWEKLSKLNLSQENDSTIENSEFNYDALIKTGISTSVVSKNIVSGCDGPIVPKNETFTAIKLQSKLKIQTEYIEFQCVGTKANEVFPDGDYLALYNSVLHSTMKLDKETYTFLPVPLTPEDDQKLNQLCKFLT